MGQSPFSVFKRTNLNARTGKKTYKLCARFFDEDGRLTRTVTLKATTRPKAMIEAGKLHVSGANTKKADTLVLDYLLDFWRVDSDYAKMKTLRGHPLSLRYIEISAAAIRNHLSGPLRGIKLGQLSVDKMERAILELASAGTSPRTINYTIQAVRVAATDYARRNRMPDPLEYLTKLAEHPRERGTLSLEEIERIVVLDGESPRVKAAVLLGALCGLRLGEVRGLQWSDIDRDKGLLRIEHNIVDEREGLKGPKSGSRRVVPLPDAVLDALDACCKCAPEGSAFVIFNEKTSNRPIEKQTIKRGFSRILARIGIDDDSRRARNLTFHGLRHSFVSLTRGAGLPDWVVQRLAGHRTASMMERYSHEANVIDFARTRATIDAAIGYRQASGSER
jgi:integrase